MFGEVKKQKLELELPQMILGCTADKIRDSPTHFPSNYTGNYTRLWIHLYHISLHVLRQIYIHMYPTLQNLFNYMMPVTNRVTDWSSAVRILTIWSSTLLYQECHHFC